ncbi:glycosyltransferase family 39 protein [Candidatus Roizmanbacteria bacterium]|nr:MAG: glycosyltransferase family 39 protein [Candidatus Roizmanbacteria bacterium]
MKIKKEIVILLAIFLIGAFLRIYRMDELAVFLADQASDSTKVFNITHGDLTLLGPITSVGGFYNGPIVYYLMAPFFFLMNNHPLSGTVFQTTLSLLTIPLIFLIGKKIKNTEVGLIAAFLFAISPLMVEYSRAAFNSYPAVFFSTLILYLFVTIDERFRMVRYAVLGLCIGWIIQMHYFTSVFVAVALAFPWLTSVKIKKVHYYLLLLAGFIIGISPFLLFEVRHEFLNIKLMIRYFSASPLQERSLLHGLIIWPKMIGYLIFGNNIVMGGLGMISLPIYLYTILKKKPRLIENLIPILLLFFFVFLVGIGYGRYMQLHYVISFHTAFFLLSALALYYVLKKKLFFITAVGALLILLNMQAWNLHLDKHYDQDGLNIADFRTAAEIISKDNPIDSFNVAMHAQGDNRAMPLRYALLLKDIHPEPYENYSNIDLLYFISRKDDPIQKQVMWEYTAFGPSRVTKSWEVNDRYMLYRLEKITMPL